MTKVFGREGDNLYTAFYEQDPRKRKKALDKWIKKTIPVVQKAVAEELKALEEEKKKLVQQITLLEQIIKTLILVLIQLSLLVQTEV